MTHEGYGLAAEFYDDFYGNKDYAGEVAQLVLELGSPPASVLDLACGTGRHLEELARSGGDCAGLDREPRLLAQAARRVPGAALHEGDMARFSLDRKFALVTCWFGSVGYLRDVATLRSALRIWSEHLLPGGVLALEPWIDPATFQSGRLFTTTVEKPEYHVVRMVVSHAEDDLYSSDFHYLVARSAGVEHFVEHHELRMFRMEEYRDALVAAGLTSVRFEPRLASRGMFLARAE